MQALSLEVKYLHDYSAAKFVAYYLTQEAVKTRISVIGRVEAEIHRRSLSVPLSTRLVFEKPPMSLNDKPSSLASLPVNEPYILFRSWINDRLDELSKTLPPLGHKDADGRRRATLGRLQYQLNRLDNILSVSWDHAKMLARIPGYYVLGSQEPQLIAPRT